MFNLVTIFFQQTLINDQRNQDEYSPSVNDLIYWNDDVNNIN